MDAQRMKETANVKRYILRAELSVWPAIHLVFAIIAQIISSTADWIM